MHTNHEVQRGRPIEVLIGFQISLGNAGLGEGKLISFLRKLFSRTFRMGDLQ